MTADQDTATGPPATLVVLGAVGDLTARLLLPGLAGLANSRHVPIELVGSDRVDWDDDQWRMHREAEEHTRSAYDVAWGLIAERTRGGGTVRETAPSPFLADIQAALLDHQRATARRRPPAAAQADQLTLL